MSERKPLPEPLPKWACQFPHTDTPRPDVWFCYGCRSWYPDTHYPNHTTGWDSRYDHKLTTWVNKNTNLCEPCFTGHTRWRSVWV